MKRTTKKFDLYVWDCDKEKISYRGNGAAINVANGKVVKVAGRDIYDAYRKAKKKYLYVGTPYRNAHKYARKYSNRVNRHRGTMTNREYKAYGQIDWVFTHKGVKVFD